MMNFLLKVMFRWYLRVAPFLWLFARLNIVALLSGKGVTEWKSRLAETHFLMHKLIKENSLCNHSFKLMGMFSLQTAASIAVLTVSNSHFSPSFSRAQRCE